MKEGNRGKSMKVECNGEILELGLSFAGTEYITDYYNIIPYGKMQYGNNPDCMFKLSATTKNSESVIDCYGLLINEKVIEKKYKNLNGYVETLCDNAYDDPEIWDATIDEIKALNALARLSRQYRRTTKDPEFMGKIAGRSEPYIVYVDTFIIKKEMRKKGYGKAIWMAINDLFAEYKIGVRYALTIVGPMNLDNRPDWEWRPHRLPYDEMYRTMANIIENIGYEPYTFDKNNHPGVVHIMQFNRKLPDINGSYAKHRERNSNSTYAWIMEKE